MAETLRPTPTVLHLPTARRPEVAIDPVGELLSGVRREGLNLLGTPHAVREDRSIARRTHARLRKLWGFWDEVGHQYSVSGPILEDDGTLGWAAIATWTMEQPSAESKSNVYLFRDGHPTFIHIDRKGKGLEYPSEPPQTPMGEIWYPVGGLLEPVKQVSDAYFWDRTVDRLIDLAYTNPQALDRKPPALAFF